jgi:hypothetical protein
MRVGLLAVRVVRQQKTSHKDEKEKAKSPKRAMSAPSSTTTYKIENTHTVSIFILYCTLNSVSRERTSFSFSLSTMTDSTSLVILIILNSTTMKKPWTLCRELWRTHGYRPHFRWQRTQCKSSPTLRASFCYFQSPTSYLSHAHAGCSRQLHHLRTLLVLSSCHTYGFTCH